MKDVIEAQAQAFRGTLPSDVWCRACGNAGLELFTESHGVPVNNARVFARAEDARALATGEIELAFCPTCGFIENARYDPTLVTYDASYEEQQSFSPTFNAFADTLAADLVRRWNLVRKHVVEIGCGKGDFLAKVCELGHNDGVGFDPTAAPGRLQGGGADRVMLRPEFYSGRTGALYADAVICRHTLEHIPDVGRFVHTLRRSLDASPGARVFFEVPDVGRVLRDGAFWDVYYEHCSYFTPGSLARLFRREGFIVDDVRLGFEDQYVLLEAHVASNGSSGPPHAAEETPEALRTSAGWYARRVGEVVQGWATRIRAARARGERVAIWGSGSKCVAFLSETGLDGGVDAVVDVNPHRQGRFLPKTGIEVAAPSTLAQLRPDLVVVMNAAYVPEIRDALAEMGLDPFVEAVG